MADPVEVILDFLQRHKFAQAEAAFKAELISRSRGEKPVLSSENVLDWDLQLRARAPQDMASLAEEPNRLSNEQTIISASQLDSLGRETGTIFSARTRSPPEKQLFVEYESGLSKSQDIRGMTSQGFTFEASPESEGCGPLSTVPVAESEGSGSIRADSSQHKQGSLSGTSSLYSLQPLPVEKHAQDGDNKVAKQSSRQNHDSLLWHQQNRSQDQDQAFLRTEVQRKFEDMVLDAGVTSSTYSLKNVEPDIDDSGNQGLISSIHIGKRRVDDKLRGAEEGGKLELLSKNSFMPSSMKGSSFKGLALKTPFPLSFLKPFGSEELQKSSLMERDATDIGGLDWTSGELQKFEITDSIVESRVVDDVPVAENKCLSANSMNGSGVLPRLPPVRIHSIDKNLDSFKEAGSVAENENSTQSFESAAFQSIASTPEGAFGWGTLSDGFLSQDVVFQAGLKRSVSRPSVSQGIVEDMSEQLSGFATAIDGQSERWYPDDYCDSDTWEDDDDPGYHRQPIEDEEWFLAHEIDYPSDDERARPNADKTPLADAKQLKKLDVDDRSFVEEESYFSGEEYYRQEAAKKESHKSQQYETKGQGDEAQITYATLYPTNAEDDLLTLSLGNNDDFDYDNHIFDGMELSPLSSQPIWKGFIYEAKEGGRTQDGRADGVDDDNHGSLRSGGLLLSSDAADVGSEVRDSLLGGSSEGDPENYGEQELVTGKLNSPEFTSTAIGRHVEVKNAPVRHLDEDEDERDMILQYYNDEWGHTKRLGSSDDSGRSAFNLCSPTKDHCKSKHSSSCSNKAVKDNRGFVFEGFSFPSPSSTGDIATSRAGSGKSLWSNKECTAQEDIDGFGSGLVRPDDTLAVWKQKSNNSSPIIGSSEDTLPNLNLSNQSPVSPHSTDDYVSLEAREDGLLESDVGGTDVGGPSPKACQPSAQEEEDAVATQEEMRPLSAEDDQYEIFDLRIIHRKNRTGFEEDKDFPVMINSVIAGRYHVTEYLGSAAFSKAIQAHDLHTGIDVCMKIIKNNKDFFDQSLDEIKLLKFVNKHDPADKYHVLRLYDYFYHREHLFIVCELLRANLYEFHKFNRESGGEVYFTMPRLQSITVQCLEALEFLHGLGIIHCDLKPENILVKSYSRCEIKIIDLGSSCFQTDHLCSYVQSRSYRAPEVIFGLPYDQKIDIWSLGCILAELCTGNVLFQNDSLATLLARVIGILGPIDQDVLAKGRDTYKYFTKNHMLYERNQETDQLEYLLPKKTSLGHRIPMGDQGFVEFVGYLLQHNPAKRPTASEALRHPWLSYPYEPISS